jgi:hypothetical protein
MVEPEPMGRLWRSLGTLGLSSEPSDGAEQFSSNDYLFGFVDGRGRSGNDGHRSADNHAAGCCSNNYDI